MGRKVLIKMTPITFYFIFCSHLRRVNVTASQRAELVSCHSQRSILTTLVTSASRAKVEARVEEEEYERRVVVREVLQVSREKERRSREERSGWRSSKRVLVMLLKQEGFVEKRGDRRAEKKMKTRFMERERRSSKRRRAKRTQPRI